MLKGIHPSASDRVSDSWTYSELAGATAAVLVVFGFGLFALGEPAWRILKVVLRFW